jgi:Domain of unknown function (DUF3817)
MKMQQNLALEGCLGKAGRDGATPEPGRRAARPSPADAARRLELGQLRRPKTASLVEGLTLVLLVCVAVPLRHLAGWPVVTAVMGPVHGLAFLFYVWTVCSMCGRSLRPRPGVAGRAGTSRACCS